MGNFRTSIPITILAIMTMISGVAVAQGPEIVLDPVYFGDPIHTSPYEELVVTLTISNAGNEALEITSITAVDFGDGTDWINVGSYPATIVPDDSGEVAITLNYNTILSTGPDPAGYDALLEIDHNAPSDKDSVYIHLTIASDFDLPQQGVLSTTWKQLMVYNTGRLGGGNDGYSLNIPDDCDSVESPPNALMYLNNASPVIAWNDGTKNLAYTTLFDQEFTEKGTFRPQSGLDFSEWGNAERAICTVSTSDSLFGVAIAIVAPTNGIDCYIFAKYTFFTWNPVKDAAEVYLGLISDWDIPSDYQADNYSFFDATLRTMGQRGAEYDSDNVDACSGVEIPETDRIGGIAVLNYHLLGAWADVTEPYLLGSGFDKNYLYNRMSTSFGYNPWVPPGDSGINLHTGVTFDVVDMTARASYTYVVAFVTTNEGDIDYMNQIEAARMWAEQCGLVVAFCQCPPGDANYDYTVNVGDAVYLINYIFKGGPGPSRLRCGDASGDCVINVGDAVYIVSYVFKGGPPPPSFSEWGFRCGC